MVSVDMPYKVQRRVPFHQLVPYEHLKEVQPIRHRTMPKVLCKPNYGNSHLETALIGDLAQSALQTQLR